MGMLQKFTVALVIHIICNKIFQTKLNIFQDFRGPGGTLYNVLSQCVTMANMGFGIVPSSTAAFV